MKKEFGQELQYIHSQAATYYGGLLTLQDAAWGMYQMGMNREQNQLEKEILKLFPRSKWIVLKFISDRMSNYFT